MNLHLPESTCPTCEAICVRYQRIRSEDEEVLDEFGLSARLTDGLRDVLGFSCGAAYVRVGRKLFKQPPGGNGFINYDIDRDWVRFRPCGEAERVVQELREEKR